MKSTVISGCWSAPLRIKICTVSVSVTVVRALELWCNRMPLSPAKMISACLSLCPLPGVGLCMSVLLPCRSAMLSLFLSTQNLRGSARKRSAVLPTLSLRNPLYSKTESPNPQLTDLNPLFPLCTPPSSLSSWTLCALPLGPLSFRCLDSQMFSRCWNLSAVWTSVESMISAAKMAPMSQCPWCFTYAELSNSKMSRTFPRSSCSSSFA